MPWVEYDKRWPDRYEIDRVCAAISPTDEDIEWAIAQKKRFAALKDDISLDKPERKECGKLYKGFCHLIFYLASKPPGDCKPGMTKELAPYADMAWREFGMRGSIFQLVNAKITV